MTQADPIRVRVKPGARLVVGRNPVSRGAVYADPGSWINLSPEDFKTARDLVETEEDVAARDMPESAMPDGPSAAEGTFRSLRAGARAAVQSAVANAQDAAEKQAKSVLDAARADDGAAEEQPGDFANETPVERPRGKTRKAAR